MTDNQLIMQFMGWIVSENNGQSPQTSWDWLMPVINRISQLHSERFKYDYVLIAKGIFPEDNEYKEVICLPLCTQIDQSYKAVVKFIKWYNQQNQ